MEVNWDKRVDEIGPRLYRYFKFKGVFESASDLVQETFIRLIAVDYKFDSSKGPLVAFALGIAHNVWRESLKKRVNQGTGIESIEDHQDLHSEHNLHSDLERLDQSEKLKLIIRRLPQVQQEVLYFYFDEEITTREISEILKVPEGTVKSHLFRAKESIRSMIENRRSEFL